MSTNTANYNFIKPELTDNVSDTIPALAENFNDIDTELKSQDTRINNIVGYSGTSNVEVVDARASAVKSTIYATLDERLESIEQEARYAVNVKNFGAIGDGVSHPLSDYYSTLGEAQVDYSFATALTNEIDWCAFTAMFRYVKTSYTPTVRRNFECFIPVGKYILVDPIEELGVASPTPAPGNFIIRGESSHSTILNFTLSTIDKIGLHFTNDSSDWDVSNFSVTNSGSGGVGIFIDYVAKSNFRNLYVNQFEIGFRYSGIATNLTNLFGVSCVCGFSFEGTSTGTTIQNSYMSTCAAGGSSEQYAGCGWFFTEAIAYSSLINCASDGNDIAYKVYNATNTTFRMTFDNCGMEGNVANMYINSVGANIDIIKPSVYNPTSSPATIHVENARSINVSGIIEPGAMNITRGSNIGVGTIQINGHSWSPYGAAATTIVMPTIDRGVYGVGDFAHSGWTTGQCEGRMIKIGNTLEMKMFVRGNGRTACVKVDVLPNQCYTDGMDKYGTYIFGAYRNSTTLQYGASKTNAGIKTTVSTEGSTPNDNYVILIEPFDGTSYPSNNSAIFIVEVFYYHEGRDHNNKAVSSDTGAYSIQVKGIDY